MIVGDDDQSPVSPLARKVIVHSIEDEFANSGFRLLGNPDQADFVIAYTVGTLEKIASSSYPAGYRGNWGWHLYGHNIYQAEIVHRTYTEGTLGIDIFDGRTKQPIWHGWASKPVTRGDRNDPSPSIRKVVAAIVEQFPPG